MPKLGNNRASGAPGLSRDLLQQLPHELCTRRARSPTLPHVPLLSPGTTWHGEQEQHPPRVHPAQGPWPLSRSQLRFHFPGAAAFSEGVESNSWIFPCLILPQIQLFLSILQSSLGVICPSQAQL